MNIPFLTVRARTSDERPATSDQSITLPDGRALSYAEYGDPNGRPVFFFHGWPNCRTLGRLAHDTAASGRVRLICPERPGFGRSDFQRDRTLADWPRDVIALADALGIDRFSIVGLSGGGPYAVACAALMGDRLEGVAVVSSPCPFDAPTSATGIGRIGRFWVRRTAAQPWFIYTSMWFIGLLSRWLPGLAIRMSRMYRNPYDRRMLSDPKVRDTFKRDLRETFRHGSRGPAYEFVLFLKPWGFRLKDIARHVDLWHGTADTMVPVTMGRYLAEAIPRCTARIYDNEGHLLIVERVKEMLTTIRR